MIRDTSPSMTYPASCRKIVVDYAQHQVVSVAHLDHGHLPLHQVLPVELVPGVVHPAIVEKEGSAADKARRVGCRRQPIPRGAA